MCDVLTRCSRPSHQIPQACAPPVPSVTFLIHASLRRGRACHRDLALCQLLHRTGYRQMRSAPALPSLFSTWKPVSWSIRPGSSLLHCAGHTNIPQGLTKSSSSLVDRWMLSILTRSHTLALFCRLAQGCMHAQPMPQPTNHPAMPDALSPGCLLAALVAMPRSTFPIARGRNRHCASWLTLYNAIGKVLKTLCREHAGAPA